MKKNLTCTSRHGRSFELASIGKSTGFSEVQIDSRGGTALQPFAQTFSFRVEHGFDNRATRGLGLLHLTTDRHERQTLRQGHYHGGAFDGLCSVSVNRKRGNKEEEEEERKRGGEEGHCLIICCCCFNSSDHLERNV